MRKPSKSASHRGFESPEEQTPSVSFGARYASVGPLPLGIDEASLAFVREIQSITCVGRSLVALEGQRLFIYFESLDDAATFLETWIFLVEQMALEDADEAIDPVRLRLVKGLSQSTLLALKQYLATFGGGGYLMADDDEGLSFIFNDPEDAALIRQQFGKAFQ